MEYDREELLAALNAAAPALGDTGVSEFSYFWFDKEHVYACGNGWAIRKVFKTDLDCGIPGRQLRDLIKTSALKKVTIEAGGKTGLVLKMGKSRVQLATLPSDRRPWKYPTTVEGGLVLSEVIRKAWDAVSFVKISKGSHSVHYGITMVPVKGGVEFYTTDSRSLAYTRVNEPAPKGTPRVVVTWELVQAARNLTQPGEARLFVGDSYAAIVSDDVLVCGNLLELPEEPDLPTVLDKHIDSGAKVFKLPDDIKLVLERASILAGAAEPLLSVTLGDGAIRLQGKYPAGSLDESLPLKTANGSLVAGEFPAPLIARGLSHAEEFSLSKRSLVMYSGEDFIYLTASKS